MIDGRAIYSAEHTAFRDSVRKFLAAEEIGRAHV